MSFVWSKRRDAGRYKVVRQVTITADDMDKIADILKIPQQHRAPGTMYIATKPRPPARGAGAASRGRTRRTT